MPLALALSPHLDDAAFSCGGTLAALAAEGWDVVVATLFAASVEAPTGFALACQTDKGLPADADYMAIRRAEETARYLVAAWKVRQRDETASEAAVAAVAKDDDLDERQLGRWLAFLDDGRERPIVAIEPLSK